MITECPLCNKPMDEVARLLPILRYGHNIEMSTNDNDEMRVVCSDCTFFATLIHATTKVVGRDEDGEWPPRPEATTVIWVE